MRKVRDAAALATVSCLMSYHLVIETPKPNLSKAIRQLNGVYTQRSNRLHDTDGHVFRGRYKSIVVQREKYLLPLMGSCFSSSSSSRVRKTFKPVQMEQLQVSLRKR